jgi:large subunit ribosomal protein L14
MKNGTVVKVADNSGPCFIRIIKIFGKSSQGAAKIGNQVVASVLYTHQRKKFTVNKGSIVRGICIRLADSLRRKDGLRLRFQFPAVIIATRKGMPRGTKIYGPIPKELREKGFIRLVSLATIAL